MPQATIRKTVTVAGITKVIDTVFTNEGQVLLEIPALQLNAGIAGVLTTRTNDTDGIITAEAHGIDDTATIDIAFTAGVHYNVDIDSVTADTITFSGGAGTVLPIATSTVTVGEIVNASVEFDADDSDIFMLVADNQPQVVTFLDAGLVVLASMHLTSANSYAYEWDTNNGLANPLTGNAVASVNVSCDSTATKFSFGTLKNAI